MTLRGELKLRNFGKQPADVVVTAQIIGKPVAASDNGVIVVDATKLQLLERAGRITWNITVKPGDTQTLTYQYERYVPSR